MPSLQKGPALWKKAKSLIPGGSQLLSKRSEMFLPDFWPAYYDRAKGINVWDLDGNKYIDMSTMGIGCCTLGYGDKDVDLAVSRVIKKGVASTLNSPEEVELAILLCKLHPWAQMVRYTRSGAEAMAVAIRLARAQTGKDKVAFCGYHGWSDWYLAANLSSKKNLDGHLLPGLEPRGVPRSLLGSVIPFDWDDLSSLEEILRRETDVGTIVMEPMRHKEPMANYLKEVRRLANKFKKILIFDEITVGFRLNIGGAHLKYRVEPDIAVFAKAMANGYAMAAVVGKKYVMSQAQNTFISSTNWTERIGPAAAIATIEKIMSKKVPVHTNIIGKKIIENISKLAKKHALGVEVEGPGSMPTYKFVGKDNQILKTLFTQEMLGFGYLASNLIYPSYAHTIKDVDKYTNYIDNVFSLLSQAVTTKTLKKKLKGKISHSGFTRLVS